MLTGRPRGRIARSLIVSFLGVLILAGLYVMSQRNYLLFHSFAEVFSVVVACGVFVVFWNSRRFLGCDGGYLLLGIAYLFVAGLDLVHALAYKAWWS